MSITEQVRVSPELDTWLRETRRYLHMNPELSLEETNTARLVANRLKELGIQHRTGVGGDGRSLFMSDEALRAGGITPGPATGGTGVLGLIEGRKPGKTLLLRADMDALPIEDQKDVAHRSTVPGVMHACGHDVHTTILLGVAEVLSQQRDQFDGTVKLMFQPAEEGPGGAAAMIHDGILENPTVDAAIALHVANNFRAGEIGVATGPATAASDMVSIRIIGSGGHAAMPHDTVDATVIVAQVLVGLQTLISREVNSFESAVVSFGSMHSGTAPNVISGLATLEGTVRTFSPTIRDQIEKRLREIVTGIASAHRATAEVSYMRGYPALNNDEALTGILQSVGVALLGEEKVHVMPATMGGEDMAFVGEKVPTSLFALGVANPEQGITFPMHHPRFDADEDALATGVRVMAAAALRYLTT